MVNTQRSSVSIMAEAGVTSHSANDLSVVELDCWQMLPPVVQEWQRHSPGSFMSGKRLLKNARGVWFPSILIEFTDFQTNLYKLQNSFG